MAGVYVHVPFCKSRCVYCGFFSTTRLALRQRYVDAVCREWTLRRQELREPVRTLYIGGGTPSQLEPEQLRQLFGVLADSTLEEVTIECNPDDVTETFAREFASMPVNRVSMGAQTFSDERLRFLHRRHTAAQVVEAVGRLRKAGIGNISIDLMYGFPEETIDEWHDDISAALALGVEHLSAYALMSEEGTPLYEMLERGEVEEADEELSRRMYYDLKDRLAAAGYEHYEISNFARKGFRSKHNSSYWNGTPYVGLGAGAHSFDGRRRSWNIDDVEGYVEELRSWGDEEVRSWGDEEVRRWAEGEVLDEVSRYNELVMTALRTREGLDLSVLTGEQRGYCLRMAKRFVDGGLLAMEDRRLRLTRDGLFVSDMIMRELMMLAI